MMAKIKIKKNDTVIVTTGNSKGVKGKVIKVYPSKNRAMVEGANMISKHTKPNAASPQGGIVKQEASIHISNLVLVDPSTGEATKIGRKEDEKTGKIVRYSKNSGEVIK
jgi:large subunit ribosomal protein L24